MSTMTAPTQPTMVLSTPMSPDNDAGQSTVTVGVDTHQRTHHGAVLDSRGGVIADREFRATTRGYEELLTWATGYGQIDVVGVESTGSYGVGLTRYLTRAGIRVVEVNRPARQDRAMRGKSDGLDAVSAARQVQAGIATAVPKSRAGAVESIRVLSVARRSAVKTRTAAYAQIRDLATTAPEELRAPLLAKTSKARITACLALRPDVSRVGEELQATKMALRSIARRVRDLNEEIAELDTMLTVLVKHTAPTLLARPNVGVHTTAQLLVTAGQNLGRLTSEAAFARLTGAAPLPASSGKTSRHRLSRGGDRAANSALYMIVIGRLSRDPRTRAYMQRRTTEGLSKPEIIRLLKRYLVREVFTALKTDLTAIDKT